MRLIISPRARGRLQSIEAYIAEYDPSTARRTTQSIRQVIEMLAEFPSLGPPWNDTQTRAITVTGLPYRIHYLIDERRDEVRIITVAHVRQRPPI